MVCNFTKFKYYSFKNTGNFKTVFVLSIYHVFKKKKKMTYNSTELCSKSFLECND